jgi:hypothetical protein
MYLVPESSANRSTVILRPSELGVLIRGLDNLRAEGAITREASSDLSEASLLASELDAVRSDVEADSSKEHMPTVAIPVKNTDIPAITGAVAMLATAAQQ